MSKGTGSRGGFWRSQGNQSVPLSPTPMGSGRQRSAGCHGHPLKGGLRLFPKELTVSQETADEVHFQGVTGKIVGRVVINGEAPDREIQVRIRSSRSPEDEYVTTDELGYFQVLLDEHTDTATIHIRVTSFDNFEWYALETMELVSVYWPGLCTSPACLSAGDRFIRRAQFHPA